jgi:hypothetical protein
MHLKSRYDVILLTLTCLLVQGSALADVLFMKNGDRITGDIKRVWDNKLYIESDYADEFPVALDAIARIESDEDFEIELRDHSEITGRFASDPSGAMVVMTEDGSRPFTPMDIEELNEFDNGFDWDARSDFSVNATRGNTNTSDFLWQAAGGVKIGDHRHRLGLRFDYKEQEGEVTKEQNTVDYIYSWFFADRWFLAAGIGYERDPIRELNYRYTPGGGVGFQFFEDADRLFEVSLSTIGVREKLADVIEDSTAMRWGLRYERKLLGGDLAFFHNHRLWIYINGRNNKVADTSTGIRWDVWGGVYLNTQFDWDWESDPAAGNEQEDVTYAIGIGVEFD